MQAGNEQRGREMCAIVEADRGSAGGGAGAHPMIPLSVVIIAFNEESNIERCLQSVRDIADEIVVLDSFSTDRTRAVCERYGVRFFQHAFDGYIQQKNRALTFASHPHVLSLDADEALDERLRESIREVKHDFRKDGYYLNRLTNYCGRWVKHCGWYPDRKLRLWDSRKGEWRGTNPHDKYEMFAGDGNTGRLKGNILHYSYHSVEDHYERVERFSDIAARAYFEKGRKAHAWQVLLHPTAKFLDHYIVKLGVLDGRTGYRISRAAAYGTYLKYKKLRMLHEEASPGARRRRRAR